MQFSIFVFLRRRSSAATRIALLGIISLIGWPHWAAAQSSDRINVWTMPKGMEPQTMQLDNGTVNAPNPEQATAADANAGTQNADPFYARPPAGENGSAEQLKPSTSQAQPAFNQQQLDYLKQNIATMQPPNSPPAPSAQSSNSVASPVFVGGTYTGFSSPQNQVPANLPVPGSSASPPPSIMRIGRQAINSVPVQILLDTGKAAGSALAPETRAFSLLKGASMTADVLRAQQDGGSFAANEKIFEKTFVMGAQMAGSTFGPVGAASAAAVAQFSYDTGKAIQPWLDSKLKLSDAILALDQKFGISRDARALAASQKEIQMLQQRVDAANLQKLQTRPISSTPSVQAAIAPGMANAAAAATPAATNYQSRTTPLAPAASPSRNAPASTGPYMTATEALNKGIGPQNLRPLTTIEKIDAIAKGANTRSLDALRTLKSGPPQAGNAPPVATNMAPINRPYLGVGQNAIDNSFSSTANQRPATPQPYLRAGQQAIDNAFSSKAAKTNPTPVNRPYLGVGQNAIDNAFSSKSANANPAQNNRPYLGAGQNAIDNAFSPAINQKGPRTPQPYLRAGQQAIDNAFAPNAINTAITAPPSNRTASVSPSYPVPSANPATLSPSVNNATAAPLYTFKPTVYGTVEIFKNGQRIATSTPDYATQRYGYSTSTQPSARTNLSGFGMTKDDVRVATKTPQAAAALPRNTEFSDAPGKPRNVVATEHSPAGNRPYSSPANAPHTQTYRQAPQVNCAQLRQQLYAYGTSGALGAACQIEDQLARYCGGPRGSFCGGGGMSSFGGFGGFGGFPF